MNAERFSRRLRLDRKQYEEVLARIEARCGPPANIDGRKMERFQYSVADIRMCVQHPEGGESNFLVFGRNISRSGISVLHGGFVYPGSKCQLLLDQVEGDPISVAGEVRHCRLIAGPCHEIGIRFEREIEPGMLLGPDTAGVASASQQEVDLRLKGGGTLLVVESFVPDHLLLEHHLSAFGLDIHIAETPGAAIDSVKREPVDLILFGLDLRGPDGLRALRSIRETGYAGPIILLTSETASEIVAQACEAGVTAVFTKPYHIELLLAQVRVQLGDREPRPRYDSTAADQPGMPPLISRFVELVRRTADQLERTYAEGEWREVHEYCRQLKGSGCGYGFQDLTIAAIAALTALDKEPTADETRRAIEGLVVFCRSMHFNQSFRAAAAS